MSDAIGNKQLRIALRQRAEYHAALTVARRLLSQVVAHCNDATVKERIEIFLKTDTREHAAPETDVSDAHSAQ